MNGSVPGPEAEHAQQVARLKYRIDEQWLEEAGRPLQQMIELRLEGVETGQRSPRRRKKRSGPGIEDLGQLEGFVRPDLPILEVVFRLLLVHGNQPMELEQISQELAEHGVGIQDNRVVHPEVLARMLDHDTYYGLRRVEA